ncbi:uncharacterized protein C8Q71DRAFT_10389 [Rhodofomes roseus]|uniref:GAR domain-containing protein n=1 Tax=Rhodofomes roseus TaxID=34475 RepID=A0ABQ8KWV6_9APHY|nr:uncharacterized protein C8Q71DRAFT_10389 [Rhodofomes roseus]KAH9843691.1 hypothetical protein C8Q71DRAFT_10389 [Rhodofomes roseus]
MTEDASPSAVLEGMISGSLNVDGIAKLPDTTPEETTASPQPKPESEAPEDEQALEWHEVIELQAFSERKAWIEEKIKFLESLPPIEVFAGLDAVRASAAEIPGLPSRAQLEEWVAEHDRIEKETEIFDSGELRKLKKFTKAAAQRNLSPADTDLIELTLTTIYGFDKLLHLLRDRSDNLDLLGIRLTWEERRIGAWTELRKVLSDIRDFLKTRARWSPVVYDTAAAEEEVTPGSVPKRRNSVVSIASMASDTSSSLASPGFSRGTRFKLAELLSRDAALFVSRVSSLKHTKVAGAGKTLDKLIDHSRKPVPDELLDEQDKLENDGINAMEDVGKFVMGVVMQWKKADELYVETLKDKTAVQTLLEELEVARLGHPTSRQDVAFSSRSLALVKRLQSRENPSLATSLFPRPTHPLFPDQPDATAAAINVISSELTAAMEQVKKAEAVVKEYHATLEAVKRVEAACKAASALSSQYDFILERLQNGLPTDHGDGGPLDLSTEACLDESRHAVFLAALPSIMQELQQADAEATSLLPNARAALLHLDHSSIDPLFKTDSAAEIDHLATAQQAGVRLREEITARTNALGTTRRVWASMKQAFAESEELRRNVSAAIDKQMWRQQLRSSEAPPTPESPSTLLPPLSVSPGSVLARVDRMQAQLKQEVSGPITTVTPSIGRPLADHLAQCSTALSSVLDNLRRSARFWDAVRNQSAAMEGVRDEAQALQVQMEDLKVRFDRGIEDVFSSSLVGDDLLLTEGGLSSELKRCQDAVRAYNHALPRRVSFVSEDFPPRTGASPSQRHSPLLSVFDLESVRRAGSYDLLVDPASLDSTVRADSNGYSMLLSGAAKHLEQKSEHFQLVKAAKTIDVATSAIVTNVHRVVEAVAAFKQSLADSSSASSLEHLDKLADEVAHLIDTDGMEIPRSFSPVRGLLHRLQSMPDSSGSGLRESIVQARRRALDDVENQHATWKESVADLRKEITRAQETQRALQAEQHRLEEESARAAAAEQERSAVEAETQAHAISEQFAGEDGQPSSLVDAAAPQPEATPAVPTTVTSHEHSGGGDGDRARDSHLEPVAESEMESSVGPDGHELDLFSAAAQPSGDSGASGPSELQVRILALRKRLRSIHINEVARPGSGSSDQSLPSDELRRAMDQSFTVLATEAKLLTCTEADGPQVKAELQSLLSEVDASSEMMRTVHRLADLTLALRLCDDALSDLLEHIDSYPSPPLGILSSQHVADTTLIPEEQMNARLAFTRGLVAQMESACAAVASDPRAVPERDRILQTWSELEAMGNDRVSGTKSRPGSVMSSGRSSRTSGVSTASTPAKKKASSYGKLSIGSANGFLAPPSLGGRRSTSSSSSGGHARTMSKPSFAAANRSVSGPTASPSSTLHGSTFASRQRTNSTTSNSSVKTPLRQPHLTPSRPRAQTGHTSNTPRTASPAFSDVSALSVSRPGSHLSHSSTSRSSWARAPRQSFPSAPRSPPRSKGPAVEKKPYIANPKNKLDVAVGEVLNRLPVNIRVELIADTWKDQSGKYWIGDQDPKLCFCRILRSQTVMVRVGGGWSELSKFIKDHFADAFWILPESPRLGSREERWINSTSLSQAAVIMSPPHPPRTPEPNDSFVPFFSLSTPSGGASPKSIKTTSSPGSPLTPLQFLRRVDREAISRPDTPSNVTRPGTASNLNMPVRQPVWRP